MEELTIFKSEQFGEIRTQVVNGEPMFCLVDVCKILDIANVGNVKTRLNEKGVCTMDTLTSGGNQQMTFVNESNLYKVIFQSRKEEAEKFSEWVTSEVLPSIRKHGAYMVEETLQKALAEPDFLIQLATQLKEEREEKAKLKEQNAQKEQIIAELQPKATYYDLILQNNSLISTSVIAKDYGMSAKKLNEILKESKVQFKQGGTWLLYQKYAEQGYTHSKTVDVEGGKSTVMHTYWTQKGRLFIYDLLKSIDILPLIERGR